MHANIIADQVSRALFVRENAGQEPFVPVRVTLDGGEPYTIWLRFSHYYQPPRREPAWVGVDLGRESIDLGYQEDASCQ